MISNNASVGILGAGISGLSTAYALRKRGIDVSIYERKNEAGGVIQTHRENGWLVEQGPNTILVRDQPVWDLLDDLELNSRTVTPGEHTKKRYIVRAGKLHAVPMSFPDFLKTDLLSTSAKFRLLKEPFISAGDDESETISDFIHRRLGREVLDYTVNPFVAGIYAGDPKQLSIKHTFSSLFEWEQNHGSLTKGYLKRDKAAQKAKRALISFDKGLQVLPMALADNLNGALQLNAKIDRISRKAAGWTVEVAGNSDRIHHDAVVSTIPLLQLENIWVDKKSTRSVAQLADIPYASMSVLGLGFKRKQIGHPVDGFGMLIPQKEPYSLLGCLFSSSLFENRAPDTHVLLTCFIGGERNPKLAAGSTNQLIDEVLSQLSELLTIKGEPVFYHHTYWPKAIPQYIVGYEKYLESMRKLEKMNPGFFLSGNYRNGVSVPKCILNGFDTAKRIEAYLL